jgi:hypothetical protein
VRLFFKGVSTDGNKITAADIKKVISEHKIRDEVASAEEFLERTTGGSAASGITIDQLSEVIRGKPL